MNVAALRGAIVEKGFTQQEIAAKIGITRDTFYRKMKLGVFKSNEIMKMSAILELDKDRAIEIFLGN